MQFIDPVTPQNFAGYQGQYGSTNDNDFYKQNWKDWASMYYQNAYNTAVLNYMNEYNSPLQQMLRYKEAGLSPWLAQSDSGNMSSAPQGAAPKGGPLPVTSAQRTQVAISATQQLLQQAGQIYDYIRFGVPSKDLQNQILQQQLSKYTAEADWSLYWNYGPDFGPNAPYVQGSPRAIYMENSTQYKAKQVEQLSYLVKNLYPSQEQQNLANVALKQLQKEIEEGQKGAILQIDTGNKTADSILQMICFWILNNVKN